MLKNRKEVGAPGLVPAKDRNWTPIIDKKSVKERLAEFSENMLHRYKVVGNNTDFFFNLTNWKLRRIREGIRDLLKGSWDNKMSSAYWW